MKFSWQVVVQVLASICQVLNFASGMVPTKYQPIVLCALTVLQAVTGLISHYYNPDGTPVTSAYVAKMLLLFLLAPALAMAQTVTPPPEPAPIPLFTVSTQAIAVRIGGQTVPGVDAVGTFNLTKNLVLQSDNILAPANDLQAYLGGIRYNLDSLLNKYVAKTTIPPNTFQPYVHAALGIVRNVPATGPSQQHYSALAGGGFDYDPLGTGRFSFGPRVEWFNAPGFGPHPNGLAVSAQLTFVLGSK
jgi:hypothetical protein